MQSFKKAIYKNNRIKQEVLLPPTVDAGSDTLISYDESEVTLNATANAPSGTIENITWTRLSGPNTVNISNPDTLITLVTGLQQGEHIFRITVVDTNGLSASDQVTITRQGSVEISVDSNPSSFYDNEIVNGFEAGRRYPVTITPALEPGETLTLNYTLFVALSRTQEVDCGGTARVAVKNDQLFRNFEPQELSVFPAEEKSGSFTLTPGVGTEVVFDNTAFATGDNSSFATASMNFTGASISGSNRAVLLNGASASFTLTNGGSGAT